MWRGACWRERGLRGQSSFPSPKAQEVTERAHTRGELSPASSTSRGYFFERRHVRGAEAQKHQIHPPRVPREVRGEVRARFPIFLI